MPTKPAQEPEPAPVATRAAEGAAPTPDVPQPDKAAPNDAPNDVPKGRLAAGVYEFTGPLATQYLEVPLTARPENPGRDATDDEPAIPATAATVFDWSFSAPDDGRWKPTKKKPNQLPDNAPANPEGE